VGLASLLAAVLAIPVHQDGKALLASGACALGSASPHPQAFLALAGAGSLGHGEKHNQAEREEFTLSPTAAIKTLSANTLVVCIRQPAMARCVWKVGSPASCACVLVPGSGLWFWLWVLGARNTYDPGALKISPRERAT